MPVLDRNCEKIATPDPWVRLADDAALAGQGSVIVSFERLLTEGEALFATNTSIGVELNSSAEVEKLEPFVGRLALVVLRFGVFRDGRPFTLARLLRDRMGYAGELRAAGSFIPDQALFLLRCGFTSFEVEDDYPVETFKRCAAAFTAWYQRASDNRPVVFEQRHAEGKAS